jgi:Cu(I)/Ag(I) efflux system periplasmic protein CusF
MLPNNGSPVPRTGMLAATLLLGMASVLLLASADLRAQGMQKMDNMPEMGGGGQAATTASGTGTVTAVDTATRKVALDHDPIPAIKWGKMKMEFATAPSVDLSMIKAGDKVRFTLSGSGNTYTVQSIGPAQ